MCGIVGAVAQRDVAEILVEGLRRLEYRGYDSAGIAVIHQGELSRTRRVGKVQELSSALEITPLSGGTGIAHTRWATHGEPTERNAHPHLSEGDIAVVHNGIIENHSKLRERLKGLGYVFSSDTDTEVICHLVHHELKTAASLLVAVQATVKQLEGAYGTVVIDRRDSERMVVARSGSPLVIGYGLGENFVASDQLALLPVTRSFAFLEEGDVAEITRRQVNIFDVNGNAVQREMKESEVTHDAGDKGEYRHYMLKEIYEQPTAIAHTLEGRIAGGKVLDSAFGENAAEFLKDIKHVQIIACGTSYHAGMAARYWLEDWAGVSCNVEIASEFRYRKSHLFPNSLLVTISQSGETADTLAAMRLAKEMGYKATLTICNSAGSSLVRESDMAYMMKAGVEIGVASTKAFTVQLAGLLMLTTAIGRHNGMSSEMEAAITQSLLSMPAKVEQALGLNDAIAELAEDFADKQHALFLGRGDQYPIAMEGALKLKEISYIHAEAYASGELKHGPLALIDADMPVIVVAPNNELLEKLKSNVEEVRARGGLMYVFADVDAEFESDDTMKVIQVPHCDAFMAPLIYTIPLQLLSYHVALIKGTDVDQPRNLAKSVTVE
ncbi:glutamine--fructose-6-phosphate transaminase (isomerizing) [Shewanella sp. SR43-4]|jgi:glucosamine--fructose-6-phosphate aminotransferase (isomerizing)|uniref:Glutamine--fructose-6-phosphate aminotransferase [isomerizing] n=1 Tax=Shewanella vesiculosa TaxID=518738 RepID=A0ABV0FTH2_9GAMM|nr:MULTISPECIES: glutamine--fructose-6-phosphate transaminase (isomerizing) [Shewanella]NCQ47123.1 glutamine--fructose-6-phosphate transaminase (isomerizing) [Shewanella frigidimarina]MBB1319509.1 glutamine--fructose-6-phosphate transaminase (isomerizing) [Shewanella sp. SR43-4]MBB1388820.1 glutamine--fructose-6-phosphate transaminase (isomerizing) [Shewanella sp. SG44-6]MBB1477650.1 glutamine--fructose-6-phosphate transaminase (isomerizing) [Shewanella sp. SG41-3]NCO73199.1 glutamine--fructos